MLCQFLLWHCFGNLVSPYILRHITQTISITKNYSFEHIDLKLWRSSALLFAFYQKKIWQTTSLSHDTSTCGFTMILNQMTQSLAIWKTKFFLILTSLCIAEFSDNPQTRGGTDAKNITNPYHIWHLIRYILPEIINID